MRSGSRGCCRRGGISIGLTKLSSCLRGEGGLEGGAWL